MRNEIRWTSKKIHQRLSLVENLAYRQRQPISAFRYKKLDTPLSAPPVAADVDDSDWDTILPNEYWGPPRINFALRTRFNIPDEWHATAPAALYLPLGISGDFSHPEALMESHIRSPFTAGLASVAPQSETRPKSSR
jgi:alpha-mannosidase